MNHTNTTTLDESGTLAIFDLSDPWVVASLILFGLLSTVAVYRVSRACCVCTVEAV